MEEIIQVGVLDVEIDGGLIDEITTSEGVNGETESAVHFLVALQKYAS